MSAPGRKRKLKSTQNFTEKGLLVVAVSRSDRRARALLLKKVQFSVGLLFILKIMPFYATDYVTKFSHQVL
jgi:hypothetical protein